MSERIKQLAEQAFMVCLKGADEKHLEQLKRFAKLVRQEEREACLVILETYPTVLEMIKAIRGRTE
jgi:hypothetical protein